MSETALWRCGVCGYVHQGEGPPAECPQCRAGREHFSRLGPAGPAGLGPPRRLVVVGGGIAGVEAAAAAREASPAAEIVLLHGEPGLPLHRLNLTRYLAGQVKAARLPLHPEAWYLERRIRLERGRAVRLDRSGRRIELAGGGGLPFDRLVLATGAHPDLPPLPGLRKEGVFVLRTLADAEAILAAALPGRRALVLGGGLLGLEAAAGLARQGLAVTVLEAAPHLLPRQLPAPGAELLRRHLADRGVAVRTGARAAAALGGEALAGLALDEGSELPGELLIVATGVVPETALAREAGLAVGRGIRVDDRGATSDPAVFAAGDAAEHPGVASGLWEPAAALGRVAGANAVGGNLFVEPRPAGTMLKVVSLDLVSCGAVEPVPGDEVRERAGGGFYGRLVSREDRLVGAVLVGEAAAAGEVLEFVARGAAAAEAAAALGW